MMVRWAVAVGCGLGCWTACGQTTNSAEQGTGHAGAATTDAGGGRAGGGGTSGGGAGTSGGGGGTSAGGTGVGGEGTGGTACPAIGCTGFEPDFERPLSAYPEHSIEVQLCIDRACASGTLDVADFPDPAPARMSGVGFPLAGDFDARGTLWSDGALAIDSYTPPPYGDGSELTLVVSEVGTRKWLVNYRAAMTRVVPMSTEPCALNCPRADLTELPPTAVAPAECCIPDEQPDCCMVYGGVNVGGCFASCDGMPLPDAAWQLGVDESGCPVWQEPVDFTGCCGCPMEADAG